VISGVCRRIKAILYRVLFKEIIESSYENRHFIARSTSTGLFWCFTPTVFIQQAVIVIYWRLVRNTFLHFHLPLAWGWTWISNPWSMLPLYYAYFLVGQNISTILGYKGSIDGFALDLSSFNDFWVSVGPIFWQVLIGSMAFSVLGALFGYYISLSAIRILNRKD